MLLSSTLFAEVMDPTNCQREKTADGMFDMVDASALLWRLYLRGIDVSERWQPLADDWAPFAEDGFYPFNDVHAAMAFVGAGRED